MYWKTAVDMPASTGTFHSTRSPQVRQGWIGSLRRQYNFQPPCTRLAASRIENCKIREQDVAQVELPAPRPRLNTGKAYVGVYRESQAQHASKTKTHAHRKLRVKNLWSQDNGCERVRCTLSSIRGGHFDLQVG